MQATLRQVVLAAIGKGVEAGVSFVDVVSYALRQEARLQTLVNSKMIEIFNSHAQTSFSDTAHSIAKASDGVVRSAEKVYSNPNAPANRKAMGALVRIAALKLTSLCDLCLQEDLTQVVNFIDPNVVAKAMDDSTAVLHTAIAKVEATRKTSPPDELSEFRVSHSQHFSFVHISIYICTYSHSISLFYLFSTPLSPLALSLSLTLSLSLSCSLSFPLSL